MSRAVVASVALAGVTLLAGCSASVDGTAQRSPDSFAEPEFPTPRPTRPDNPPSTKQPQPSQQQQAQQPAGKSAEVDERQRVVRRHQAFSEMCAAGQRCEVAAKRLRAETGDTLYFRDYVYLDKLRDDFTAVSKLLRASGAVSSKGARAAAAAASGGGRE